MFVEAPCEFSSQMPHSPLLPNDSQLAEGALSPEIVCYPELVSFCERINLVKAHLSAFHCLTFYKTPACNSVLNTGTRIFLKRSHSVNCYSPVISPLHTLSLLLNKRKKTKQQQLYETRGCSAVLSAKLEGQS